MLSKLVNAASIGCIWKFHVCEKLTVGLAYRWSAACVRGQFQISNGMYIGYGYDRETTPI
jgi:hypothetical protein